MDQRRRGGRGWRRIAVTTLAARGSLRISSVADSSIPCQYLHGNDSPHISRLVRQTVGAVDAPPVTTSIDLVGFPIHQAAGISRAHRNLNFK